GKSASAASSLDASRAEAMFSSQATVGSVRKDLPPCPTSQTRTQHLRPCIYGSEARSMPRPRSWRSALTAAHLLGLATARLLREPRAPTAPLPGAMAQLKEADLRARLAWSIVEILGSRLDKIPDRQRPHFTPAQRFRILEIKALLGWNRDIAARLFRVSPDPISYRRQHADSVTA